MPQTTKPKRESQPDKTTQAEARDAEAQRKREAREDAEASRQDRPGTSLPTQRERWENEGGAPGGVISSTDAVEPKKSDD